MSGLKKMQSKAILKFLKIVKIYKFFGIHNSFEFGKKKSLANLIQIC